MPSKHKGETDEQFKERNRRYMAARKAAARARSGIAQIERSHHHTPVSLVRAEHITTNMWPECLIGLSDDEMVAEMHKRRGRL
jgi:hypothetical protein